ncbi:MAG: diguanylate cyclase [Thiohalomonadaceae bacterium]
MTRSYLTKPLTLISTFAVLVASLLVADGVSDRVEVHERELEQDILAARAGEIGARLEAEVHRALQLAQGLALQALADSGIEPPARAGDVRLASPHVRDVVLVGPGQAPRGLLHQDPTEPQADPALVDVADRVQATGRTAMAGPFDSADHGRVLVFVLPAGADTLHVTLDLSSLLHDAGLSDDVQDRIALRDGTSSADAVLFGQRSLFAHAPVRVPVTLPGDGWELVAAPEPGGAGKSRLRVASVATALIVTLLAFVLLAEREREKQLALHDPLTNLPNRLFFDLRLEHAINRAERHGRAFALLYLDLDDFKPVNDAYGHKAGDRVLIETGRRIRKHLRRVDTVARIGGDEFMVILDDTSGPAEAEVVAHKLIAALREPINVGSHHVRVGVSIGASFYPTSGATSDQLIRRADLAMYHAKSQGKNRVCFDEMCPA